MEPEAPETYDDALREGFKAITAEEFRAAVSKPPRLPDFSTGIPSDAADRCDGKPENHKCQNEINIGGSIFVGYCKGGTCKYLIKS